MTKPEIVDTSVSKFEIGAKEVRLLLAICVSEKASNHESAERNNAILRAAAVLLVSHFESYLKSLAYEYMDSLTAANVASSSLPIALKEYLTIPHIESILSCNDPMQRQGLYKKLTIVSKLWEDNGKPSNSILDAKRVARSVTNGQAETIDAFFVLMGSKKNVCDGSIDICDENDDIMPMSIKLKLSEIVKCRNDIAHGTNDRKPTQVEIRSYLLFLDTLVNRLYREYKLLIGV